MSKILMYFAMFVGAILIASWVSREASYFFSSLLNLIRYNWLPMLGLLVIGAIAYKVVNS